MKRLVSIALLALYLFNLFGYMATFLAAHGQIRREIKQRIKQNVPENELVVVSITPDLAPALQWIKTFEFRYRGSLYDVVRTERSGDTVRYFCINDRQEEQLFAGLDGLIRRQMESDARTSRPALQAGASGSQEHMPSRSMTDLPAAVLCMLTPCSLPLPLSPVPEVAVPPPRVV